MRSVQDYYEMVQDEEIVDEEVSCTQCNKKLEGKYLYIDIDESSFCCDSCFDEWTIDQFSSESDHVYEQEKERRREQR